MCVCVCVFSDPSGTATMRQNLNFFTQNKVSLNLMFLLLDG